MYRIPTIIFQKIIGCCLKWKTGLKKKMWQTDGRTTFSLESADMMRGRQSIQKSHPLLFIFYSHYIITRNYMNDLRASTRTISPNVSRSSKGFINAHYRELNTRFKFSVWSSDSIFTMLRKLCKMKCDSVIPHIRPCVNKDKIVCGSTGIWSIRRLSTRSTVCL